jgi:hypothetical protein
MTTEKQNEQQQDPSGMTGRSIVNTLRDVGRQALKDQLDAFGPMMKKAIKESTVDGFSMGFNFAIDRLREMNVIFVAEDQ